MVVVWTNLRVQLRLELNNIFVVFSILHIVRYDQPVGVVVVR